MRIRLLIAVAVLPLALWAVLPLPSQSASPQDRLNDLQRKIQATQGRIGRRKGTERVLTTQITAYTRRISTLEARIGRLQRRQATVQADLDAKRAELSRLQGELRSERRRLVRLRARLAESRAALGERLIQLYQADKPDIVTVILNAKGFADLLERGEFMERVSEQDQKIIGIVRTARADALSTERKLSRLATRQRKVTKIVLANRNVIAGVKEDLIGTRVGLDGTRSDKRNALLSVREERHELEGHLAALRKEESGIRAKLAGAGSGFTPPPGGGLGPARLAGQRPDHRQLRRGTPRAHARGHRHRRPWRHADPRRGLGQGRAARVHGRLRQLHLRPAHREHVHVLRAPVGLRDLDGRLGQRGPGHRLRRQHRALDRRPPALRGARQRSAGQPDGLPVAPGEPAAPSD